MTVSYLGMEIDSRQAAAAARELDKLTPAAKRAEQAFQGLERSSMRAANSQRAEAQQIASAYGIRERMTAGQVATIRQYETLIGKQALLNAGMTKEAAVHTALRKANTTADTQYGRVVKELAGIHYDLENAQERAGRSSNSLANTLTRRFLTGLVVANVRQMVSAVMDLNRSLADVGDISRRAGMSSATFQGMEATAGAKGISGADFGKAVLDLGKGIDAAKRGSGELLALFRLNGVAVKDTEDAFYRVADLVRGARSESEKLRILQEAGLPATREFVKLMEQGGASIRDQVNTALADGVATSQLLIDKARGFDEAWNRGWANFKLQSRSALADAFDGLNGLSGRAVGLLMRVVPNVPQNILRASMTGNPMFEGTRLTQSGADDFYRRVGLTPMPNKDARSGQSARDELARESLRLGLLAQTPTAAEAAKSSPKDTPKEKRDDRDQFRRAA